MLKTDETGRSVLGFEADGIIRRIPIERRGVSKNGREWVLGGVLLEVYDANSEGSAQLYLITWEDTMIEMISRFGVGKKVHVRFHIESREKYDRFDTSVVIDDIMATTDKENFVCGIK